MAWSIWEDLQFFRREADAAEERWFLQFFHGPWHLNELARLIAHKLADAGLNSTVQVSSVWVDGVPQAEGHDGKGTLRRCELADLLYVVEVEAAGRRETCAVLLQGKMTDRAGCLPASGSTRKERALLEDHAWPRPLRVFAGYGGRAEPVGNYQLQDTGTGLESFGSYVLIASSRSRWPQEMPPFHVGWPRQRRTAQLRAPVIGLASAAVAMARWKAGSPGHPLSARHPVTADWPRLVQDLCTRKSGNMRGYGAQPWVQQSSSFSSGLCREPFRTRFDRVLRRIFWIPRLSIVEEGSGPPPWLGTPETWSEGGGPLIPIIKVHVRLVGDEEDRSRPRWTR